MTATAGRYRPLPISQRDMLLAANGVDDCRAVAATYLAAAGTLGEVFITPRGTQMGRRGRTALVKRARRSLGPSFATGPLNTTATTNMLKYLVPGAPPQQYRSLPFGELRKLLRTGHSASLSGNPGDIKGASPLKRAGNVGHEFYLHEERENGDILVGDPYKPYSRRFGEWRPASEVRQFAFKDSDQTVTACFTVKRGAWTAARLTEDALAKVIGQRNTVIKRQKGHIADLEAELAQKDDCEATRQATIDQCIAAIEDLRDDAA